VIDLTTEIPLPLAAAAKLVPPARSGKRTHLSTLVRWITRGAPGPDGQLVRLDAVRLGSRWVTSRQALQRFAEALTPRLDDTKGSLPRSPRQRQQAADRAAKELEKIGI
jgi:hypothetical protein